MTVRAGRAARGRGPGAVADPLPATIRLTDDALPAGRRPIIRRLVVVSNRRASLVPFFRDSSVYPSPSTAYRPEPSEGVAQNVPLGSAANFAVLGATPSNTDTRPTVVVGDVGVWPAASITGFPPGTVIGTLHLGDAVAQQAQTDLTAAYLDAAGWTCPAANNLTGLVLGSGGTVLTLVPGVYCFSSTAQLTGNLILNGAGVYIFQIGSGLTTASGSAITLTNGASPCGVWWQVGSSATVGTTTSLAGIVLALRRTL